MRADKREYNAANADRRAAYMHEYRQVNPHVRRDWGRANPDKVKAQQHKRRAALRNALHEPYTASEIFEACDYRCAYCDAPAEHLDHIMPLARGGADAAYNVTGACATCNQMKSDMDPDVWVTRVLASAAPLWTSVD
jgi:5-methylcytosine-specific restriction endonuclease McrA